MIQCSGPLTTQLGVLLDEVSDRCLQRHSVHVLALIVHLLVVASPCMPQMNHLALPLVEGCIEHLLGSFCLPGRAHVEVVELTVNRPERDSDGRVGIGRIENPVLLSRCTQPFVLGRD